MSNLDIRDKEKTQELLVWVEQSRDQKTAAECKARIERYQQEGVIEIDVLQLIEDSHNAAHQQAIQDAAALAQEKFGPGFHLM